MSGLPRIVVVGSINRDLVARCQRLPRPGETQMARDFQEISGGKGANQAVAAAKAGGKVTMVGRVGDDAFGVSLLRDLESAGVDTEFVQRTEGCASGIAVVMVEDSGQNSIVVAGGANSQLGARDVLAARRAIEDADVLLVQMEVPLESVLCALQIARESNVRSILDPAPAPSNWPAELLDVDLCCPNEGEAAACVGFPVNTVEQAKAAALLMQQRGARHVAITRAADGVLLAGPQSSADSIMAFATEAVDSTAAGDTFAGTLAVRWAETNDLETAVRFGNAAAAISVSRFGAQTSMPTRGEIEERLRSKS